VYNGNSRGRKFRRRKVPFNKGTLCVWVIGTQIIRTVRFSAKDRFTLCSDSF